MQNLLEKRIFIIDDDPFWAAELSKILWELGYTNIVKYSNGTDALNSLHLNPSLVFLDYQMEDMNGLEVLTEIKDYFPGIGVIFCTAFEDLSVAVKAIKNGSYDYLLKQNANKKEVASIIESMAQSEKEIVRIY